MTQLLLYAITKADAVLPTDSIMGIDGTKLELMRGNALAAIVSAHSAEALKAMLSEGTPETLQDHAIGYHQCLNTLSQDLDLLPARFGTALQGFDALNTYLATDGDALSYKLAQIENHLEWTIRLRQTQQDSEQTAPMRPADYLRQRHQAHKNAAQAKTERAALAQTLAEQLAETCAAQVLHEPVSDEMAAAQCFANLRALCPRGCDDTLLALVSTLACDLPGVEVDVYGPEAPFRFSSLETLDDAA